MREHNGLICCQLQELADEVSAYHISNQNGLHLTLVQDISGFNSLMIWSEISNLSGSPLLTILVPNWVEEMAFICEFTYSGREFLASIALDSRVSPLTVVTEAIEGAYIGSYVKWTLANYMYRFLSRPYGGGLVSAWIDAGFNTDCNNNTVAAALLGTAFSQR